MRKEDVLKYCSNWRDKNSEKLKDYYDKNKQKRRDSAKLWQNNNKDKVSLKNKEWNLNNKERRNEINRNYYQSIKDKEKTKVNRNMRKGIYKSLRGNKNSSWLNLVDYSIEKLTTHLKNTLYSDFTWDDYLNGTLHIDHIIPIALYEITDSDCDEFKKCWDLRNLRLLEASENLSKQDYLDWTLIKYYNLLDLLPNKLRKERDLV